MPGYPTGIPATANPMVGGSFGQKMFNCGIWYVTLDDVSFLMAGGECCRDRKLRFKRRKITDFVNARIEAGCSHMLYPT